MTRPNGTLVPLLVFGANVGSFKGEGGVNVGRRVGSNCNPKAATEVGLSVGVVRGTAVGGAAILGRLPGEIETNGP